MFDPPMIRPAAARDADAIAAIYAHHVAHGTATFDFVAPDKAAWRDKIASQSGSGWPFLVALSDYDVLGYAYAVQFRDRPGYRFTCENSIYVAPDAIGRGVGRWLLTALIDAAAAAEFRVMLAVIGGGAPASVGLHRALGFRHVGCLEQVGVKHGQVLDVVYMQRQLTAPLAQADALGQARELSDKGTT